jgi:hypothetical protein
MGFGTGSRPHFRPLVTLVIVGVWLVLMGALLRDRYLPTVEDVTDAMRYSSVESDDWFLIRIQGSPSGFGRSRQYRQGDHWVLRDDLSLSLNIQGQVKPVRIASLSEVDEQFRLITFAVKVTSGIISFEQRGHMDGRTLVLEIPKSQGGGTKKLKLVEPPRLQRSLGLPVPLTGLKTGEEIHVPVFDPIDGQKSDAIINVMDRVELEISGKKMPAWHIRASFRTMEVVMWVDSDGRLLKGRMPLGITVVRSDKEEISREMRSTRDLPEMMGLSAVPVEGDIPRDKDISLLKLQVSGDANWSIPSDGFRQTVKNSEVTIVLEQIPEATYTLPCTDPAMEKNLEPSRFIQSDSPEIIAQAKKIIGNVRDPVQAARLINSWVYENVKKVPTPSIPDAATVLMSLEGDCNEHAVLAAALARAVGIPSRIAVGVVPTADGYNYHAWVTYWAGKKWVTGDPLMNQFPVGVGHLALLYGDVDKHVNVMAFLGRLQLKVVEAK